MKTSLDRNFQRKRLGKRRQTEFATATSHSYSSRSELLMATNEYVVEYAKTGRASCKNTKCKKNIAAGDVRIGKVLGNKSLEKF